MLLALLAACVSLPAFGGVSATPYVDCQIYYDNPLSGAAFDWKRDNGWRNVAIESIIDFHRNPTNIGRLQDGSDGAAWATLTTSAPVQIGTVIVVQEVWPGFDGSMPYQLRLGGNGAATAWNDITPLESPGTLGECTMSVYTLDSVGEYNALRLDVASAGYGGAEYIDIANVIVLPGRLEKITDVSYTTSNANTQSGNGLVLTNEAAGAYWYTNGPATIAFTFAPGQQVDAIIIWSLYNGSAEFTIRVGEGAEAMDLADVAMIYDGGNLGWILPITFDQSIGAETIYFDFKQDAYNGLQKVMFLTAVPEPATMSLLALGGLALLRRR